MTSIPTLLSTGHRLFSALLMEARVAMEEGDWADAQACLAEFARRLEAHMHAEETVLFPRLEGLGVAAEAILAQCRREHGDIRSRISVAVAAADARDREACDALLAHLIDALSRHCQAEERSLYTLTDAMGDDVLGTLAGALSHANDQGKTTGRELPPNPRLH